LIYCEKDLSMTGIKLVTILKQVVKESIPTLKSPMADKQILVSENIKTKCQKIPYNQKVEQDLR
ncbi:3758_t:CDS:2, partial [Funneliformis mosseae]